MVNLNIQRRMFHMSIVVVVLLSLSVYPLYSGDDGQVSIDDLFNQPVDGEQDVMETGEELESADSDKDPQTEESVDLDALTTSPVIFNGSVSAGIGMGAGLSEWPGSTAADGNSFSDLMRYSGFYSTTAILSVDARPEPWLRFFSSVSISLDANAMVFNGPSINEVFIDYTFNDTFFFRVGRQGLTWGNGRLLGNPANLVSRVSEGVAVRGTIPTGSGTINGVVYSKVGWVNNPYLNIDPRTFAYAGQWESSMGPLAFSLSSHFKMNDDAEEDIGSVSSFSFGIGPFDLAADLVGHWDRANPTWKPAEWEALGQIFWENDNRSWSLLCEYLFDSSVESGFGHYAALGIRTPKLRGSGWQPTLRWKHAFQDNSGEIIAGISGSIAPNLNLAMGIPLVYGAPGTYYRNELSANWESDSGDIDDDESSIPVDNVLSLLLSISLNFSF